MRSIWVSVYGTTNNQLRTQIIHNAMKRWAGHNVFFSSNLLNRMIPAILKCDPITKSLINSASEFLAFFVFFVESNEYSCLTHHYFMQSIIIIDKNRNWQLQLKQIEQKLWRFWYDLKWWRVHFYEWNVCVCVFSSFESTYSEKCVY